MNNVLVTMAPAIEPLTSAYSPARSAARAITSSVRLPSVAFSKPPTASPVFAATDSVAWLSSVASGTTARIDRTNRVVPASCERAFTTNTAGTKTSSHNTGLCRISFRRGFIRRGPHACRMPHAESGQITKRPAIFAALALKPAYALRGVGGIHHEPEQQAFPGGHAPLQPPASGQEEPRAHFEDSRVAGRTLIRVRRPIVYYL